MAELKFIELKFIEGDNQDDVGLERAEEMTKKGFKVAMQLIES